MIYLLFLAGGIIAGFLVAALILGVQLRQQRSGKKKSQSPPVKKSADGKGERQKTEFSKVVLLLVMATYFVGLIVGIKIVLLDTGQLSALLLYIGGPTTTAIAFYAWKAKAENLLKIQKENPETPIDFNNITGG